MAGNWIEVRGLQRCNQALKAFPIKLQQKALKSAFAAGARRIAAVAKQVAAGSFTQRTGATVRNITVARGKKPTRYAARYIIGVRHIAGTRADKFDAGASRSKALRKIKMQRGLRQELKRAGIAEELGRLSGRKLAKRGMNPYYWRFLELGTVHISARRFLTASLRLAARSATQVVANRLRAEIGKLGGRPSR